MGGFSVIVCLPPVQDVTGAVAEALAPFGDMSCPTDSSGLPRSGWRSELLTLDGWWIQDDGTAHHGTCGEGCPHRPDAYNEARGNSGIAKGVIRYVEGLPPETVLVRAHCHW